MAPLARPLPPLIAAIFLAIQLVLTTAHALPLPVRFAGDTVVVRAEAGMESIAREVAHDAPRMLADIRKDLEGLPGPRRIEIRLVKDSADLSNVAPAGRVVPTWAAGVAFSDVGIVAVAMRRGHNPIDVRSTTAHELAHLVLSAALAQPPARWLNEGFAYLHSADWSMERLQTLAGMAWTGNVIPLSQLDASFPAKEHLAARAYAQSYDFVAFLARRGRYQDRHDDGSRWAFRRFLAFIASGHDEYSAAAAAYDKNLPELFEEWATTLKQRYLLLPSGLVALGVWVLAAILLVLGWMRRRRQNRQRLAIWERQEAEVAAAQALARRERLAKRHALGDPGETNEPTH